MPGTSSGTDLVRLAAVTALILKILCHLQSVGSTVTFHNHSDCCCENIYPRSAKNLVSSISECTNNCAADAQCHAAVYLMADVAGQCELRGRAPAGKACCIHKKHYDGLNSTSSPAGQVVIDMGTSTGPCPKPHPALHPPAPPKAQLARPTYHFTRCSGEMNDPNGLQWRYGPDGKPQFHMFFQAAGAGSCPARVHGWGHTMGPDMVSWTREPASGVCGSSGGGITLPNGFKGPNGEPWLSANIASAPFAGQHPAVGLHLFTSTEPTKLQNYSRYIPAEKKSSADPCVICPELVPAEVGAGYIGDNYVFQEPAFNVSSRDRTFYVLSGTNLCANRTDLWCGYPAPGTPAAMLFSSKDLLTWKFVSLFTDSIRDGHWNTRKNRVDCPDTFTLPDGRQVLLWLDSGGTRWNIGTLDRTTMQFTAQHTGLEGHNTGVTQSVWDPQGRRVQLGWIGTPFSAAQTLPHEIRLSSTGDSLVWLPLPEMATLHGEHRTFSGSLQTAVHNRSSVHPLVNPSDAFGLHLHATATFTFGSALCENVTLAVSKSSRGLYVDAHCGPVTANLGVLCSLDSSAGGGRGAAAAAEPTTTTVATPRGGPSGGSALTVDVFVDSVVVEIFAGGAHVAHVLETIDGVALPGTGVEVGVIGGSVDFGVDLWAMAPSISPACPHDEPFAKSGGTNAMKNDDEQAATSNEEQSVAAAAVAVAPTALPPNQFTAYSCGNGQLQPTVGGNVFSAIRIAHSKQPGAPKCPGYNASADPLGPCFISPEVAKAYLDKLPAGHRSISLEGQPTLYTVADGAAKTVPRGLECFDQISRVGGGVRGPWLEHWSTVVQGRFEAWFGR